MSDTLKPETAEQVLDAVKWAVSEEVPLDVRGLGSKHGLGRPTQTAHVLDISALSGIKLYEPGELVMTVGAATPLADILKALEDNNQELAFEPLDFGRLLSGGKAVDGGSIGGLVAANASGPRRIKSGAARDHFLGFSAVSGRGEVFKSGGRVMKNVTGFDLSKLLAGSFGTLAVMTEVTLKVLPKPDKVRTVLVMGVDDENAAEVMSAALGSSHEVSAAAHLPADIASRSAVERVSGSGRPVTAVRVEGPEPSVAHRCAALRQELGRFGDTEELHSANSATLWREVRDGDAFAAGDTQVWRISVPPMDGGEIGRQLRSALGAEAYYDWGGGLIWLSLAPREDAGAEVIRQMISAHGGHATLIRAASDVRGAVDPFQPQPAPVAGLTARVKEAFDPKGVLNPGRMYQGV